MPKKKWTSIDIGNSLVFERVMAIKLKLDKMLQARKALQIVSSGITEIDLTGIQLLHYFQHQALSNGLDVNIKLSFPEEQKNFLGKNGFSDLLEKITS
jgi:hypothetical protein